MGKMKARFFYAIRTIVQPIQDFYHDKRLKNKDFTIISSTCAGGIIYHRCRRKFMSPTVNLWFSEKDLQKMALNLKHYMEADLTFINSAEYDYPIGLLDDIQIGFNHAKSEEEARELWNRRRKRVNYNNVWLLSSDHGLSYEDIKAFAEINVPGGAKLCLQQRSIRNLNVVYG